MLIAANTRQDENTERNTPSEDLTMRRKSMLILATIYFQKLSQVYSIYEQEDVQGYRWYWKTLLIQQTKCTDQQSNDQHNRKINEKQTTYDIVNYSLFFQLFLQSFQQVHKTYNFQSERPGITSRTVDYVRGRIKAWLKFAL